MTTDYANDELGQLGLTARQRAVYLALLQLGSASVQQIAHQANLERTGLYHVLDFLKRSGLVGEAIVGKKRQFVAQDPEHLVRLADAKKRAVQEALPELKALWKATDIRPRVQYYQGRDGMRTVIEDTLSAAGKDLVAILSAEDLFAAVGERWFENYTKQRIKSGFRLWVVRSPEKEVGERWPTSQKDRREVRYAPAGMVFSLSMYIYGHKVAMLSTRQENFGLILESDEFATHQKHLFDALWQISKPAKSRPKGV